MSGFFSFFSWQQVVLCGTVLLFYVALIVVLHRCSLRTRRFAVYTGAFVLLLLEIMRYTVLSVNRGGFSMEILSFQFCNILAFYIPVSILFFRNRYLYGSSALFGFVAGLAIVLLPFSVIDNSRPIEFLTVQSIISHGLMAFLGYMLIASKMYVPKLRDFAPLMSIFLMFCAYMKLMCYIRGANYFGLTEFLLFGWGEVLSFPVYFFLIYVPGAMLLIAGLLYITSRLCARIKRTE